MSYDSVKWALNRRRAQQEHDRTMYECILRQDDRLVAKKFPPMSPWWRGQLSNFYTFNRTKGVYRLVARVGRRGGKSSTMVRVSCAEVLHGNWQIPPGDVGVWCFFSVKTGEAESRLDTLDEILHALGYREGDDFRASSDRIGRFIRLESRPLMWRALPANFRTSVGFTSVGGLCDELARWRDEKTGANPAQHVLETWRPAMSTQLPYSPKELMTSSPWSTVDAHYAHFERGSGDTQYCVYAPTWEANPTLSKADCEKLAEKEGQDFAREYEAVPMPFSELAMFDPRAIEGAVDPVTFKPEPGDLIVAGADMGFKRNSSALVIAAFRDKIYHVLRVIELRPRPDAPLKPSEVCRRFAEVMSTYGCVAVTADAHYRESVEEHLAAHEIAIINAPTDVAATYIRFRTLLHQNRIRMPDHQQLRRDLTRVQSAPTPTGRVRVILPQDASGRHADIVSALVLATWQEGGHLIEEKVEERYSEMSDEEFEMFADALGGRKGRGATIGDVGGESWVDHGKTWLEET